MEQKYIVALEIGSSKIKGAIGIVDPSGTLTVHAVEEEKLVDSVRYGCIRNVMDVSNCIARIIRKLDNRLAPRKIHSVYVGIGGRSFISLSREIQRQLPQEMEITHELIHQLKEEAYAGGVYDREVVAVIPGEFTVDKSRVTQPIGVFGQNIRAVMHLISCRPQIKRNIELVVNDKLSLRINGYIVRQLAEANLVLTNEEKRLGCVFVDFGAETTTVSVYKDGTLRYLATLPLGSRNITRDLTAVTHSEERAEDFKIAGGNAMPNPAAEMGASIDFNESNNYVSARAAEIIANIKEQVKYAGLTTTSLPGGIVIVGSGAKLKGFNERMTQMTKMKVRCGQPTLSSSVLRVADSRIPLFDSIDVISILVAAARRPEECTVLPEPDPVEEPARFEPDPEPEPEPREKSRRTWGLGTRIKEALWNLTKEDDEDEDE